MKSGSVAYQHQTVAASKAASRISGMHQHRGAAATSWRMRRRGVALWRISA